MNEILGPIYFVLASDSDLEAAAHAEADSFYLFSTLIMVFRDHFMRGLDNIKPALRRKSLSSSSSILSGRMSMSGSNDSTATFPGNHGIGASMERMMQQLKEVDVELYDDLVCVFQRPSYQYCRKNA